MKTNEGAAALAELLQDNSVVVRLARHFRDAGYDLYLVGGPVRDAFLGRPFADLDLTTDARPEKTHELVKPLASAVWLQGIDFGTVGAEIDGRRMEITTFRTERYEPDSRHPDVAFESDVEIDLSRRDFTVNAMAVRPLEKTALDPFGGLNDLKQRILKTPIDPDASFTDDPLRMLRAFRFASQLDFRIDPSALESIGRLKDRIKTVSSERIRDELSRLLVGSSPGAALEAADATGLTDLFLAELGSLKLEQDPVHKHKDVFHHTLAVVERTPDRLELRLAALLHDIGKPKTRRIDEEGVTFHHHEIVGARMAKARLTALRYPNSVVSTVERLIELHHRFHTYRLGWSDSAVRRYVRDAGPLLGDLNALVRADCTTRNPAKAERLAARMDELERRIAELAKLEELERIRPELDGNQIMAFLGVGPGPLVGEASQFLLDLRLDEGLVGPDEAYERLAEWARGRDIEPAGEKVPPKKKKGR
ncbi:MAG: CCA tRNA nucleotidyltransferase [Actinomycetota bacterium]|jgi:poly(A) polymerase